MRQETRDLACAQQREVNQKLKEETAALIVSLARQGIPQGVIAMRADCSVPFARKTIKAAGISVLRGKPYWGPEFGTARNARTLAYATESDPSGRS